MAATLALTAVLLGGVFWGKHFLLARLVTGLDDLDSVAKQKRMVQIASFGVDGVAPLVDCLIDDQDEVSESAFNLLRQLQNDWITLPPSAADAGHAELISAIDRTYHSALAAEWPEANPTRRVETPAGEMHRESELTVKQFARARELVKQTLLEYSSQGENPRPRSEQLRQLLAGANRLLADLDTRPGGSAKLVTAGGKLDATDEATVVSPAADRSGWTDWPPPAASSAPRIVRSGRHVEIKTPHSSPDPADSVTDPDLLALPPGASAALSQPPPPSPQRKAAVLAARHPVQRVIQTTTHLVDSPLAALNDETVIRHLANPDTLLADRARAELIERGFSETQLETATALALAGPQDRIRLIDSLVHSSGLDSGPWLSMLLDDPDRQVRLHVASRLAQTEDAAILKRLRERLSREQDAHVAARLRRILGYR